MGKEEFGKDLWIHQRLEGMENTVRVNLEIDQLYKQPNIVILIKIKRIQWVVHLIRMDGRRFTKKIFEGKLTGRRDRSRPRLRWLDCVEKDLNRLGTRGWRNKAEEREK